MGYYVEIALPLVIVAVALAVWLAIHRRYKKGIKSGSGGLLDQQKDLAVFEESSMLTAEERRRIRKAVAKKMKDSEGEEDLPGRKRPIDIRELYEEHSEDED